MFGRVVCLFAVVAFSQVEAQQRSIRIGPPFGPENRLFSPDGEYALFGNAETSELWLDRTHAHQRRLVVKVTVQTLTVAWSPDSTAFLVNDRMASDRELSYIYDVKTLNRIDLSTRILAADSGAIRFVPSRNAAPHSYFHALEWVDRGHVEVQLHGHTDGIWNGISIIPGACFDMRYYVGRDGIVQKLSELVSPIKDQYGCAASE